MNLSEAYLAWATWSLARKAYVAFVAVTVLSVLAAMGLAESWGGERPERPMPEQGYVHYQRVGKRTVVYISDEDMTLLAALLGAGGVAAVGVALFHRRAQAEIEAERRARDALTRKQPE